MSDEIKEVTVRLAPKKETLSRLFAVSGNECAFPGCTNRLFDEEFDFIGEVCHIEAAMPDGERFNKSKTNEERRLFENLMGLCHEHHVKTDNVQKFSANDLKEMKRLHELKFHEPASCTNIPDDAIDRVYSDLKKISEAILKTVQSTDIVVKEMFSYLTANLPSPSNSNGSFGQEIDSIISLRDTNNQDAAVKLFETFWAKNENQLSDHEKYRTLANIGICSLEMNEEEKAAEYFLKAYDYAPNLLKAINLAALGYCILEQPEQVTEFVNKALAIDPESGDAYQALIYSSQDQLKFAEIIEKIPENVREKPEVAYALAFCVRREGDFIQAVKWCQIAIDNATGDTFDMKAALATFTLESIDAHAFVLNNSISQQEKNRAELAIRYYTEIWEKIKDSGLRNARSWWIMNRAIAKKFLGDKEGAYDDMLEGISYKSDFWNLRHLSIAAFDNKRFDKAFETLEKMATVAENADESNQVVLFRAEIEIAQGKFKENVEPLRELLEKATDLKLKKYVEQLLVRQYEQSGEVEEAVKLNDELATKYPEDIIPLLNKAGFAFKQGLLDEGQEWLDNASALVNDATPPTNILILANEYKNLKLYDKAVPLFERIADPEVFSSVTRNLLVVYYEAGESDKLLKACKRLQELYGPIDMVTELMSFIYEQIGDILHAIESCEQYLSIYPEDQYIQVRLASIYYRTLDKESIRYLLSSITHIDKTLPPPMQFRLGMLFHYLGENEKFFKFTYETRRYFYEFAQAHETFVSLTTSTRQGDNHPVDPQMVGIDAAVTIEIGSAIVTYILENRRELFGSRGEIDSTNPIFNALIGKAVGDEVEWEIGGNVAHGRVVRVWHKYNYAFSESIELLTTKFAGETGIRKLQLGTSGDPQADLKALFESMDELEENDQLVENIYRNERIPIGVISNFRQVSPIHTWANYMSNASLGVFTTGPYQEIVLADQMIKTGKPLLLDMISIVTLSALDCLPDLLLLPNRKLIAQSTLEEFYDLVKAQEKNSKTGSMVVGKVNGQYAKQVLSAAEVQAQVDHLNTIIDWIKNNCEVLPVNAALNMNAREKERQDKLVGRCFIDSVLTAKEQGCLLYAEEMPLRGFASHEHSVSGCATFMLLIILKDNKQIDSQRFCEKMLQLICMNYKYLPVDGEVLHYAAVKTKYKIAYPLTLALEGLNSPLVLSGYAEQFAVNFFYKLYAEPVNFILTPDNPFPIRAMIEDTLRVLLKKFRESRLEGNILERIDRKFRLIPVQMEEAKNIVRDFFKSFNSN